MSYSPQIGAIAPAAMIREATVVLSPLLTWIVLDVDIVIAIDWGIQIVCKIKPLVEVIWIGVFWLCVSFTVVSGSLWSL